MKPLKIIFIGTPDFGLASMDKLYDSKNFVLVAVITQKDKKVGRKQLLTPPPIKTRALDLGIPVHQAENITDIKNIIKLISPDMAVVIAYSQIIPADILNIPKYGFINLHASLLPKYRGAACIQAPILNGDEKTGVTIMQMDKSLDTGPILSQKSLKINSRETLLSLHDRLSLLGAELLLPALIGLAEGKINPVKQDNSKASYVGTIKKEDGRIDWTKPAIYIDRHVRAMNPWPGAFSFIKNAKKAKSIKILEANVYEPAKTNNKPGIIITSNNKLLINCATGVLEIKKLQMAGKKELDAESFLQGNRNIAGEKLT